jgi:hypothetical protein
LYDRTYQFITDSGGDLAVSASALRARATTAGQEVTFTCVPPGSGVRIALDRDGDGVADEDERTGGTDPANPASTPSDAPPVCITSTAVTWKRATLTDKRGVLSLSSDADGLIMTQTLAGILVELKGTTYRYKAPKGATGIKNLSLKEKPNALFKVTARTTSAWTLGEANQPPASTEVTLNIGGDCFRGLATKVH